MSYMAKVAGVDVDGLLRDHKEGYALPRPFYTDEAVFEVEFEHLMSRQWQYVDHMARIPRKGDFVVFRIAGEEIIVVRGDGETVYAHFNVCRHRGSRICLEETGHVKRLTCPYHAWSYRLDGSLANARAMGEGFDKADFGLKSCQVEIFEGLIFVNLSQDVSKAADFESVKRDLRPWVAKADLRRTKIAFHEVYPSKVNWKIAVENYFECYHCLTTHPELCKVQLHTQRDGIGTDDAIARFEASNLEWTMSAKALGHKTGSMVSLVGETAEDNYGMQGYYAERMLLHDDPDTVYERLGKGDLLRPSKLLGAYEKDDNGQVDWGVLPGCFVYTSCTSTVIYRITPISPTECELSQTWLVHEDAEEGVDYSVEGVSWLDRVTQFQDEAIVSDTQAGVSSRFYEPGPYATLEGPILQIHRDYIRALRFGRGI